MEPPPPQPAHKTVPAVAARPEGTTPAPYGNFLEDRQSLGLSLTGTLNNNLRIGASYSAFFGGHILNKSKDMDFASVTASYTF